MTSEFNTLNYTITGTGHPVVFLHGFLENSSIWDKIVQELPNVQAICIDLPGHGESPLLEKELSLPLIAMAVKQVISSLSIHNFSIVGHSLGGYVALYLAEYEDLQIDRLVLFHSHPWADTEEKKINRVRATEVVKHNKSLFINEAVPNLYYKKNREILKSIIRNRTDSALRIDKTAIVQTLLAMRNRESKINILKKIGNKLHIIQGEFDSLIDAKEIENLAKIHDNEYHLIRNVGHMGYDEATEEVVRYLFFVFCSDSQK